MKKKYIRVRVNDTTYRVSQVSRKIYVKSKGLLKISQLGSLARCRQLAASTEHPMYWVQLAADFLTEYNRVLLNKDKKHAVDVF